MKHFSKSLVCLLLVTLLAAAALIGCAQNETPSTEAPKTENQTQTTGANAPIVTATAPAQTPTEMGEGEKLFYLEVTFDDGGTASYAVHTDAETVGQALQSQELIEGENGLYNTVCGKTLDWNADHMYWAFYIDGAYTNTGLDDTPVEQDQHYALIATEG